MVNNGVYTKALYWPKEVQKLVRRALQLDYKVFPTEHLLDRLYEYDLPEDCWGDFINGEVVECEIRDRQVYKIVTRTPSCKFEGEHNCAAIVLETGYGRPKARIVTVWINFDDDNHSSIKTENYVTSFVKAN